MAVLLIGVCPGMDLDRPRPSTNQTDEHERKIIGIDLGTTNSCVAVMGGNEPVVIANSENKATTPSVVAFVEGGMSARWATRQAPGHHEPRNTIFSIKRFMGNSYDECSKEIGRVP